MLPFLCLENPKRHKTHKKTRNPSHTKAFSVCTGTHKHTQTHTRVSRLSDFVCLCVSLCFLTHTLHPVPLLALARFVCVLCLFRLLEIGLWSGGPFLHLHG